MKVLTCFKLLFFVVMLAGITNTAGTAPQQKQTKTAYTKIPIESVEEYSTCCEDVDEAETPSPEASRMNRSMIEHAMPVDAATFRQWKEESRTRRGVPRGTTVLSAEEDPFHSAPVVSSKFEGLDQRQSFQGRPPDTNIAVGETHILEATNFAYRLSTKTNTNVLIQRTSDLHNRPSDLLFDPRVHYDRFSKRFIAVAAELFSASHVDIAISRSAAPADLDQSWCTYRIRSKSPAGTWPDLPIVGMNEKWLVITTNQYTESAFKKSHMKIIDLSALSNNADQCPKLKSYGATDSNPFIFPAQHHTQSGSSSHPLYMIATPWGSSSNEYFLYTVQGSARPSVSRTVIKGALTYGFPPDALQPGGLPLSTLGPMVTDAEFRNGSLYFAHNTVCNMGALPNESCARIAKLNVSDNSLRFDFQVTVGGGHNNFFWFPSIAVNSSGNLALLFQQSGKKRRLGLAHTSKRASAANFSSYKILQKGECSREVIDGNDLNRNGDYTGVHIDPADDKGAWYAAEYAKKFGSSCEWGTYIVNVKNP